MKYIIKFTIKEKSVTLKDIPEPVLTSFIRSYTWIADNNLVLVEIDNTDAK